MSIKIIHRFVDYIIDRLMIHRNIVFESFANTIIIQLTMGVEANLLNIHCKLADDYSPPLSMIKILMFYASNRRM